MATIRKRGERWEVRYDAGVDFEGKRIQKRKGGFRTKPEAVKFLTQVQNSIYNNTYVEPTKRTVAEYLKEWLENYVEPNLATTTITGYKININHHISPYIGHMPLQKLKPSHVQELYNELQKNGRVDGTGGLSAKSITYVHRVLNEALKHAERLELIPRNPAAVVSPPKVQKFNSQIYDNFQIKEMLDKFKKANEAIYMPVFLAAVLGLRRGEVLGLKWEHVDDINKTINIVDNRVYDGKNVLETDPKSEKSKRVIAISDTVIKELKDHKKRQNKFEELLENHTKSSYICTYPDGKPFQPYNFSKLFTNALKRHQMPRIRFHDLRHSNATLMLKNNVPAKVASERLGHSTVAITLDLYSHVMKEMQEETAAKIDTSIFCDQNVTKLERKKRNKKKRGSA